MHNHSYSDDQITPWFSMTTQPVRQGTYELRMHNSQDVVEGRYADGKWLIGMNGFFSPLALNRAQFEWRGLNFDPKLLGHLL